MNFLQYLCHVWREMLNITHAMLCCKMVSLTRIDSPSWSGWCTECVGRPGLRVQLGLHCPEQVHHQFSKKGENPSRHQQRARRAAARNAGVEEEGEVFEKRIYNKSSGRCYWWNNYVRCYWWNSSWKAKATSCDFKWWVLLNQIICIQTWVKARTRGHWLRKFCGI